MSVLRKSPAAQGRDPHRPPEELPALQPGGGLLCPPLTSTAARSISGSERASQSTTSVKDGREDVSAWLPE